MLISLIRLEQWSFLTNIAIYTSENALSSRLSTMSSVLLSLKEYVHLIHVSRNDLCIAVVKESFSSNHTLIVIFLLDVCQAENFGALRRLKLANIVSRYAWIAFWLYFSTLVSSQLFRILSIVQNDEDFESVRNDDLQELLSQFYLGLLALHQDPRVLEVPQLA